MAKHASHMWICGAMIAVAVIAVALTGSTAFLLPAVGCVLMMGAMMWMMMRTTGGDSGKES